MLYIFNLVTNKIKVEIHKVKYIVVAKENSDQVNSDENSDLENDINLSFDYFGFKNK